MYENNAPFSRLFLASATSKTFANDIKITPIVMQSFQSLFRNATQVKWSVVDRLYKAEFTLDDEQTTAFFNIDDGSLVASCRYMAVSELPRKLQQSLKIRAASDLIVEVF